MTTSLRSLGGLLVVACVGATAQGQSSATPWTWRPSADPVVARADSLTATGDTVRAISMLEAALKSSTNNAALWHRYGLLLWQVNVKARSGGLIGDKKVINTLRVADSALRLATKYAPDSAEYWATLARFNLQSNVGTMRFSAEQQMARVVAAATRTGDSTLLSEGADELGMAIWRRFESTRNRAHVNDGQHVQFQTEGRWKRSQGKDFMDSFAKKIQPPTGEADYNAALRQFETAVRTRPSSQLPARHLYMCLAVGKRWENLLAIADRRAGASAFDADARLARGLALQRMGRTGAAQAAFDSALARMDEAESATLFRIDRLLPTTANFLTGKRGMDQKALAAIPPEQQATMSALFWALNDPVSTTIEHEARAEFMARVVQAEWQWSDIVQGLRGADTDRGDIFVRYGPPDDEMTVPDGASVQQSTNATVGDPTVADGMTSSRQQGGSTLVWFYNNGESFFFELIPGFGRARLPLTDQKFVADLASVKPAGWDNVAAPRRVDTLSVRTVRFRAAADSTDVVIVTKLPLRTLAADSSRSSPAAGAAVRVDLLVVDGSARTIGRDSSRAEVTKDSIDNGGVRSWVRRVGPGAAFMRVEAVQTVPNSDERRSANAVAAVDAERAKGFGASDVLLVNVGATPLKLGAARWNELGVTPSSGDYRTGEKIGLAWEMYDLAVSDNANRYRLAITVERTKRSGVTGLALRVLDGVGGLVKQGNASSDKLSMSFDRNVAAKPVQVEFLALDWLGDAKGEYRLRIEVTDVTSNRTEIRETRFRIQ